MKWIMNIARFLLAAFAPGAVFLFIFTKLGLNSEPFTNIITIVSLLFALEIAIRQTGEEGLWTAMSRSRRDKLIFAISLFVLFLSTTATKYFKIKPEWMTPAIFLLALLVIFALVKIFGSKEMNEAFAKPRKKRVQELPLSDG
jgi:cell division protein FtsW (lipid II flippase)